MTAARPAGQPTADVHPLLTGRHPVFYIGLAEPLHSYDGWTVRSHSVEVAVPAGMLLKRQAQVRKRLQASGVGRTTSQMVFLC